MDSAELLEQLADIHLPAAVSFWPPAPGWWLLAILLIAVLISSGIKIAAAIKSRRICAFALAELERIYTRYAQAEANAETQQVEAARLLFVNELNAVLRRVALWHYPDAGIASLGGRAWVDFIREKGDASRINEDIAAALREGRFRPHCDIDVEGLKEFGRHWISSLYQNRNAVLNAGKSNA
ncbi:MAG: DUF4381 domain-containing protein [Pseudohongiellaceae bacterium]